MCIRDSLYKDPVTGEAYLIRDVAHQFVGISRLTDDYLNTTGIVSQLGDCEGMAMYRLANGTYYLITSHLTGWSPNPLIAWRSDSTQLENTTWTALGNPTQDQTSFNSQPTYVVRYTPRNTSVAPYYVYMGDNWEHCGSKGLEDACYVWLPIRMGEPTPNPSGLPLEIDFSARWNLEDPWGKM